MKNFLDQFRGKDLITVDGEDPIVLGLRRCLIMSGPEAFEMAGDDADVGKLPGDFKGFVSGSRIVNDDLRKFLKGGEGRWKGIRAIFSENGYADHGVECIIKGDLWYSRFLLEIKNVFSKSVYF